LVSFLFCSESVGADIVTMCAKSFFFQYRKI
jgi:hypothetical protein